MTANNHLALLNATLEEHPELLDIYIGDDAAAALAKAQEMVPEITAEELDIYRESRAEILSIAKILQRSTEDSVFAAKLASCESSHDLYVLGGDLITVPEEQFAKVCDTFLTGLAADESNGELSEEDLAMVVGGANIFQKIGGWMKDKFGRGVGAAAVNVAQIFAKAACVVIGVSNPIYGAFMLGFKINDSHVKAECR